MKIILSSRNPGKICQVKSIFFGSEIQILSLDDVGVEGQAIEDGETFYENAHKKADFAFLNQKGEHYHMAMGDDSGIMIDALNHQPGVYSARWAGENATPEEIVRHTLNKLDGVNNRKATLVACVVIVHSGQILHHFEGKIRGTILRKERVPPQPGMPYGGIFLPNDHNVVLGEMDERYLNRFSHRGQAMAQVRRFLESYAGELRRGKSM